MIRNVVKSTNNQGFYIYKGQGALLCRNVGEVISFDDEFVYLREDPQSNWITPIDEYGYAHTKILLNDLFQDIIPIV